ncbi:DUF2339 domain-containing protein [Candidatus Roizmanbacteria bacterium]|nr:DUF2339 domain-containing protein [Candidatus Roizmanbacteria bacterium]
MEFIALLVSIVVFLVLNNKIKNLESDVDSLKQREVLTKGVNSEKVLTAQPTLAHMAPTTPPAPPSPPQQSGIESFFKWFAIDWPLKTGGLFIILGFVWLVTYAFLNNWIGPTGRIVFGLIVGSVVLALGDWWIGRSHRQGVVLVSVGASIMMVTIWAAQSYYHMFPPVAALGLGALVMVLTAISSIRHDDKSLISVALIFGGLAPILTGSTEPSIVALFSYLLVVVSCALWIVYVKEWRFLTTLSLIMITLYSVQYFFDSSYRLSSYTPTELLSLHFFAVTFSSLFYFASIAGVIRKRSVDKPEMVTAVLVAFYALGWINGITPDVLKSIVALGVSIGFMLASYIAFQVTTKKEAVYMYAGAALVLLVSATAYEFEGPVLVMALAAQAAIVPIIIAKLLNKKIGAGLLLYFVLPVLLSIESFASPLWSYSVFHNDFFALLSVTAALFIAGLYFYYDEHLEKSQHDAGTIMVIIGSVYGLALIWLVSNASIHTESIARMVTFTLYTLIGLGTYVKGQIENRKVMNKFGLILLLFVVARLLIVEVWIMQLAWRIVTFFAIGLLLMGSVLIRKAK